VTDTPTTDRALGPHYYGHGDAATLRRVAARGDWLSVSHGRGRLIRHINADGRHFVMRRGARAAFAICAACGTFAEISYVAGNRPFCSASCTRRRDD